MQSVFIGEIIRLSIQSEKFLPIYFNFLLSSHRFLWNTEMKFPLNILLFEKRM